VTVPSCDEHNSKNSMDVEYVRNVIVSYIACNTVARTHFQDKVIRSFENSPKLFDLTVKDVRSIVINGEETCLFTWDLPRFKAVMEAIAYGLHHKDFTKTYNAAWGIFSPSLLSRRTVFQGLPDGWEKYRRLLTQLSYTDHPTPQPRVFKYGIDLWDADQFVYKFEFYEGFIVHALAVRESAA
jgi:hypothetical protein